MKIGWIRYPQKLYTSGKVLRGGSEIANQYVIDFLRNNGVEVIDFMPESDDRLALIDIPAIGTPLMFQDLIKKIDQMNQCDLIITTNWFGAILPELKVPLMTIFHSNANMVMDSIKEENIFDQKLLSKWLKEAKKYDIAKLSKQSEHEMVISIGENYFANHSNHIVAVSELLKNSLVKYYGTSATKITVINNAYDANWENTQVGKDFINDDLAIINITRLPADFNGFVGKGTDRILEIFKSFPKNKKFLLASAKISVYPKMLSRNIKNLQLIENADRQTVKDSLSKAHISVHCSRAEACQLTLIEAMLMKTVPISFKVGVAEELINQGQNGFLVDNIDQMKNRIKWLENHRDQAEKIAQAAHDRIKNKLSIEQIGKIYLETIKEILRSS